jgi:hypothetical protein
VTPLPLGVPSGFIKSVAINSSGRGLIGGLDFSGFSAYAALVSPTGVVTPLDLAPGFLFGNSGVILSVAINSSGRGLIGGVDDTFPTPAYAALISPAGAVTPLSLGVPSGFISSVAINDFDQGLIGGRNTATGAAYAALVSPAGQVIPLNVGLSSGIITSALS